MDKNYNEEKFDIVILAGQSNAEGNGLGYSKHVFKKSDRIYILEDKNRPYIQFNENGVLVIGKELQNNIIPADEYERENGERVANLSLYFAEQYLSSGLLKDDRKLLIVYAAIGGSGFSKLQWGKDCALQKRMFEMTDYCLNLNKENRVVAFLWHQGEHDAFENAELSSKTREMFYYDKFSYLLKEVKEKYGDIVPIAGGFCEEWVNSGYVSQANAVYRASRKALKEAGGYFVETKELLSNNEDTKNGDDIHFSRNSLYLLGRKYFKAYKRIIDSKKING